nr:hypothetical protein [uncultured Draconibacterium sp.]
MREMIGIFMEDRIEGMRPLTVLKKIADVSLDDLQAYEGMTEDEKIEAFIKENQMIIKNTKCKIVKYKEYVKTNYN